jgi:hypothetical protein
VTRKSYYKPPLMLEGWMEVYVLPECVEYYDDNGRLRAKECTKFTIMLYDTEKDRAMRRHIGSYDAIVLLKFLIENLGIEGEDIGSPLWRSVGEWLKKLKEVTEKANVKWDEL